MDTLAVENGGCRVIQPKRKDFKTAIRVWSIKWWKNVSVVVQHSRNDDKNWTGNLIWSASTNTPAFTIQLLLLFYKMKLHPLHYDYYHYHFNAVSVYPCLSTSTIQLSTDVIHYIFIFFLLSTVEMHPTEWPVHVFNKLTCRIRWPVK